MMLTQDYLREIVRYDPETGAMTWLSAPTGGVRVGAIAGTLHRGYVQVTIKKQGYKAHRLAWFYMTGSWPKRGLDHINGVKDDNRWANLREASQMQNLHNIHKASRNSKSGLRGVHQCKRSGKWIAQIVAGGVHRFLGRFESKETAYQVRLAAKAQYQPFGESR